MKYFKLFLFVVASLFVLTSCDNITEEFTINQDGSGEYKVYTDMVPAMTKTITMMGAFGGDDEDMDPDKLEQEMMDAIWEEYPDGEVDSLIDFEDQIPDAIKNDPIKRQMFDKMKTYMKGSRDAGELLMGMSYQFDDAEDFMEFNDLLEDAQKDNPDGFGDLGGLGGLGMMGMGETETDVDFKITNKTVSRKTKWIQKPDIDKEGINLMEMMLGDMTMRTVINLPRPIKKAKGANLVSAEGKTAIFEVNMMEYVKGNAMGDFEIIMK